VTTERDSRAQDLSKHMSIFQEMQMQLQAERKELEDLKDKHAFDIHTVMEKAEAFQRHVNEMFQDHQNEGARTAEGLRSNLQGHVRDVNRVRADHDTVVQESRIRFEKTEDRCTALENRIAEMSTRQAAIVDRLVERHERVSSVVENLRLEEKQNKDQVRSALTRMKDLQTALDETESSTRDLLAKERKGREDQLRLTQLSISNRAWNGNRPSESAVSLRSPKKSSAPTVALRAPRALRSWAAGPGEASPVARHLPSHRQRWSQYRARSLQATHHRCGEAFQADLDLLQCEHQWWR